MFTSILYVFLLKFVVTNILKTYCFSSSNPLSMHVEKKNRAQEYEK